MTVNRLPAHVLLVHLVVVLLPVSAVAAVLVSVWPAATIPVVVTSLLTFKSDNGWQVENSEVSPMPLTPLVAVALM